MITIIQKQGLLWFEPESGELIYDLAELLDAFPDGTKIRVVVEDGPLDASFSNPETGAGEDLDADGFDGN
jgi:hypothetical protein